MSQTVEWVGRKTYRNVITEEIAEAVERILERRHIPADRDSQDAMRKALHALNLVSVTNHPSGKFQVLEFFSSL